MPSESFKVVGGKKLKGSITPQGAKNETLQILCAVLLTDKKVTITNVPDILIEVLRVMVLFIPGLKLIVGGVTSTVKDLFNS